MSTINLLPDDYFRKKNQKRANILCIALFIVIMVGLVFAAVVSQSSNDRLAVQREKINGEYSRALAVIGKMRQMELRKDTLAQQALVTSALMERVPRSYLLGLVARHRPANLTLYKFELETKLPKAGKSKFAKKSKKKGKGKAGKIDHIVELYLTGYARSSTDVDVARYLQALEDSPIILRADLETTKDLSDEKMVIREFKFKLLIDTKADVIDLIKHDDTSILTWAGDKLGGLRKCE